MGSCNQTRQLIRMKTQLFFGVLAYSLSLLSTEVQAGTPACTSLKERSAERNEVVVFSEDFDQKSRIPDSEYWSFIPERETDPAGTEERRDLQMRRYMEFGEDRFWSGTSDRSRSPVRPIGARSLARHLADAGKTDISGVARLWGD